jgi:predicted ATP-binding protein involved in virulence
MISVASEKNISTAKKRDIAPFKVNGQSHIILEQLSCGTRSKVSFVSNPAQISLKHSSQLTNKTTLATSGAVAIIRQSDSLTNALN